MPPDDLIKALRDAGLPVQPAQPSSSSISYRQPHDEVDTVIIAAYRELVKEAIEEAKRQLRFGSTDTKVRITTVLLTHAARLSGKDSGSDHGDIREKFEELMKAVRGIEQPQVIDAKATAVTFPTYHQD